MHSRSLAALGVLALFIAMGVLAGLLLREPIPAAIAWIPPGDTDPPTPPPTGTCPPTETSKPWPTSTPWPTSGIATSTPLPTDAPGVPTETPLPPDTFIVDVAAPVPPEPVPFPWVGVVDYLRRNVCVTYGGHTACQGDWIDNANPSLYENSLRRQHVDSADPISQGDMRPAEPDDDVHIPRPQCLVNGGWVYVPGTWYYNGLSNVVVEDNWHNEQLLTYGPPQFPVEFTVLVRYHRAYVPEPNYPGQTAWNFGALGECHGGGGGGEPPPSPPPSPTPAPTPASCPNCNVSIAPPGLPSIPYLTPWQDITLTWSCHAESGSPIGYIVRVYTAGSGQWDLRYRDDLPEDVRQLALPVDPGFLYRAEVTAIFDLDGTTTVCCSGETYYRYYQELPTGTASLEARVEYWSEHDPDYPNHGPASPYRTSGSVLAWNYGETLHVHPTAELIEPVPPAGWAAHTALLRWRFRGSVAGEWHPARCDPPDAPSCGWFDESPRTYIHLRWFRNIMPGEIEGVAVDDARTWVYRTDPTTVTLAYQVQAETTWTHTQTGLQLTWPAFTTTLTVTVDLQRPTTYRGAR